MTSSFVIFAYFGPETVLPMTSIVATVVGLFMMFGRNTLRFIFRWRRTDLTAPKSAEARVARTFPQKRRNSPLSRNAENEKG